MPPTNAPLQSHPDFPYPTPLHPNGHSANGQGPEVVWTRCSVRDFFTQINWADQTPEVQALQISTFQGEQPELSLQLSVSQFFKVFPWGGKVVAAPIAIEEVFLPEVPEESSDFTIDDFSDLF